jgi:hypothetical protein
MVLLHSVELGERLLLGEGRGDLDALRLRLRGRRAGARAAWRLRARAERTFLLDRGAGKSRPGRYCHA